MQLLIAIPYGSEPHQNAGYKFTSRFLWQLLLYLSGIAHTSPVRPTTSAAHSLQELTVSTKISLVV